MPNTTKRWTRLLPMLLLGCGLSTGASGQLTLGECRQLARENYPLVRKYDLIRQSEQYNLKNAAKGYLPQLSLSGKATLQTDVTKIPVSLPGIDVPTLSKDQYQALLEVSQTIWDGGAIRAQKQDAGASADIDRQQFEVDMYTLNGRVNDLFFGILLLDEQLAQNGLYRKELQRNYDNVAGYMDNGIANQADLDAVAVELLAAGQQRIELESLREAYAEMLGMLTGTELDGQALVRPSVPQETAPLEINRPELGLFDARDRWLDVQRRAVSAKNRPKISAFVQGAYGNPGLNMLKEGFMPYAIGGIRLSWNFGNLYTSRNSLRLIETSRRDVATQRDVFLFNTRLEATRQSAEAQKYRDVMRDDDRIVELRENIRRAAEAKVAYGTLSVTELIREIHAEESARQSRLLHGIELLKSIYELKNTTNN